MFWLLESKGNFAFKKAGKIQGRGVLAPEQPSLVQLPCAKTQEFCKAEFLDSTPVSALFPPCCASYANGTGNLFPDSRANMPVSALETGILIPEFSAS